jgi:hypothetical protein
MATIGEATKAAALIQLGKLVRENFRQQTMAETARHNHEVARAALDDAIKLAEESAGKVTALRDELRAAGVSDDEMGDGNAIKAHIFGS